MGACSLYERMKRPEWELKYKKGKGEGNDRK